MERKRQRTFRDLEPFLPPRSRLRILSIGVIAFVGTLAESAVLVILTLTANSLIRGTDTVTLGITDLSQRAAALVAIAMVCIRVVAAVATSLLSGRFASQVMLRAQSFTLRSFLASSHPVRSSRPAGDLAAVVASNGRYTGDLASDFVAATTAVCGLAAFGGTSLLINPLATVGIAVLGITTLVALSPLRRRARITSSAFTASARDLAVATTEIESLHREIEVFDVAGAVSARADDDLEHFAAGYARVRFFTSAIPQLFQSILLAAAVLSLLVMIDLGDHTDLGVVGAVALLLIRSMSSAQQLVSANQRMAELRPYAESISSLIDEFRHGAVRRGDAAPQHVTPVRLTGVSFSYDENEAVLTDIDLELHQGELVGIVGASGAGKTTLVELLLRLRQPTSGRIVCADTPMSDIRSDVFARRVAFVPQHAVLIDGTVAENIDLFRGLGETVIRDAVRRAHLEAEVEALPEGIHTRLGPDDRSLSGGQRQRLTIARALAGHPEVLVLDEPTSALDAESEHAIRQTLETLAEQCLVVVIAHRHSTLRSCTRIVALEDGRIQADAGPDEVARRSEFFQRMVDGGLD